MGIAVCTSVLHPGSQWLDCWRWFFPVWPPSVNHTWRSGRSVTYLDPKVSAFRKAMLVQMALARAAGAMPASPLLGDLSLEMVFYPPGNQRRDLDNLSKAPLDAFTHTGLWHDDSQVKQLRTSLGPASTDAGFWACVRRCS